MLVELRSLYYLKDLEQKESRGKCYTIIFFTVLGLFIAPCLLYYFGGDKYLNYTNYTFYCTLFIEATIILTCVLKLKYQLAKKHPLLKFRNSQFYLHAIILMFQSTYMIFALVAEISYEKLSNKLEDFSIVPELILDLFVAYLINSFQKSATSN